MKQQIERICKIVDELRQFARPVCDRKDGLVNINEVLRLTVQISRYDPRAKSVEIITHFDPSVPAIRGNADRWQQVFLNLVINAFDAMPNGGRLTIASELRDERVYLVFRDTGEGISPEHVSKLFHPFCSTKRSKEGSGLGLAVCQAIVNSYGGEIEIETALGRGSEFRVVIPVRPADLEIHHESTTSESRMILPDLPRAGPENPAQA